MRIVGLPEFATSTVALRLQSNFEVYKGEDDWKDYDLTNFIVEKDGKVFIILEKRSLYADGYPHIKKDAFDKSHKVELNGHIHAEGIIFLMKEIETICLSSKSVRKGIGIFFYTLSPSSSSTSRRQIESEIQSKGNEYIFKIIWF